MKLTNRFLTHMACWSTARLSLFAVLTISVSLPATAEQFVFFKGKITNIESYGSVDAINQYLAVNDTFEGSFAFNPAATGSPTATINGVGTWLQYPAATSFYFDLRVTSGASAGYGIHGAVPSLSSMSAANNVLNSSTSPDIIDLTSGVFWHNNQEFRPGLTQRNMVFRFWDWQATMLNSASLSTWNPDQVFQGFDYESHELAFNSTQTSFAQIAKIQFTEFTLQNAATPVSQATPVAPTATSAALLGGNSGTETGALAIDFNGTAGSGGSFQASYAKPTTRAFIDTYGQTTGFAIQDFTVNGDSLQLWELDYSGELSPGQQVTLSFKYDDTNLAWPEAQLGIMHFGKYGVGGAREWKWLRGEVDTVNNVITVSVDHFSPFALGGSSIPEPNTLLVALLGLGTTFAFKKRLG